MKNRFLFLGIWIFCGYPLFASMQERASGVEPSNFSAFQIAANSMQAQALGSLDYDDSKGVFKKNYDSVRGYYRSLCTDYNKMDNLRVVYHAYGGGDARSLDAYTDLQQSVARHLQSFQSEIEPALQIGARLLAELEYKNAMVPFGLSTFGILSKRAALKMQIKSLKSFNKGAGSIESHYLRPLQARRPLPAERPQVVSSPDDSLPDSVQTSTSGSVVEEFKKEGKEIPTCSICLDDVDDLPQEVAIPRCKHVFCLECLKKSVAAERSHKAKDARDRGQLVVEIHPTCPLCRAEL